MPATVDVSGLKNLIDVDALRILETTRVAGGASSAPLDHADHRRAVITHLSGDMSQVNGVVDVYACRRSRILPLPATHHRADGVVEVVEYRPETHSGQHFVAGSAPAADQAGVDARGRAIPPRVQRWKNSLLDLSLRNKLINFTETGTVALAVPDGALPHVEDMLNAGKPIALLPSDGHDHIQRARGVQFGAHLPQDQLHEFLDKGQMFTPVSSDSYLTRFRGLAYKAKTIVEETGANNLYLALGSLNWSVAPKQGGPRRAVKSPLILVPVTLVAGRRGGHYQLVLDEAGASTPNFCLIEKLRQEEKLSIPGLENPVEDEHGIDLAATFDAVRKALAENGLGFHVDETADLAILQFAKFRLWKDLDDSWEQLATAPLVRHMIETPGTDYLDPAADAELGDLDELDAACPIPADGSQLEAIAAAVAGRTFVLEGPPGTGKSQTITNLLARAIAGGKRVLFVAEKRAALDVVNARLAAIGLSPFCLDLHDKSSKPAGVRAQILQALDLAPVTDEQGFTVQRQDLAASARALDLYARRLHEKNPSGLSYYSARTQALALGEETPALPVPIDALTRLTPDVTANLRHLLGRLNETADLAVPRPHHPWGFVRRPGIAVDDLKSAVRRADAAAQRLAQAPGALGAVLDAASSPEDLQLLHAVLTGPAVGLRDLDEVRTRSWSDRRAQYEQALASFTAVRPPGPRPRRPDGAEPAVGPAPRRRRCRSRVRVLRPQEADSRRVRAPGAVPGRGPEAQGGAAADRRAAGDPQPCRSAVTGRLPPARPARPGLVEPVGPGHAAAAAGPDRLAAVDRWRDRPGEGVHAPVHGRPAVVPRGRRDGATGRHRRCRRARARARPPPPGRPRCGPGGLARRRTAAAHLVRGQRGPGVRPRAQQAVDPLAQPPAGARAAARGRPGRGGRPAARRRRPGAPGGQGVRSRDRRGVAGRAPRRDRPGRVRRRRPQHVRRAVRGVLGVGPGPPPHRHPAADRRGPPVLGHGGARPGQRAAPAAGPSAGRHEGPSAPGHLRRPDHPADAVRAGQPGLGRPLLPGRLADLRPGRLRRGVADPRCRRGRGDRPGAGRGRSSATASRCRRRRSRSPWSTTRRSCSSSTVWSWSPTTRAS